MAEFIFSCPKCKKNIQCEAAYAGSRINCPVCQQAVLVPPAEPLPRTIQTKAFPWRNVLIIGSCLLLVAGMIVLTAYMILPARKLTFRVSVDGADIVKLSGNKLWLEHQSFRLPTQAMINGKKWDPIWNTNRSMPYALNRTFRPDAPILLSKQRGRGTISIVEMPSPENDETLAIKLDDNDSGGADWYEFSVSW